MHHGPYGAVSQASFCWRSCVWFSGSHCFHAVGSSRRHRHRLQIICVYPLLTPAGIHEETHALDETFLNSAYEKHLECEDRQAGSATGSANGTKFIVPAQLNEQLSKAVGHFADVAVIGAALNRTLVLPRVGRGEISVDLALPFCSYFDLMSLQELVWITSEQLIAYRQSAGPEKLTGAYIFLTDGRYACSSMFMSLRVSVHAEVKRMAEISDYTCYNGTDLLTSGDDVLVRGKTIEAALSEALKQVDVLFLVKKEMYHRASSMSERIAAIESKLYNHHPLFFEDLTTRFIEKHLGFNYLALQWRTEKCFRQAHCDGAFFDQCSKAAIAEVEQIINSHLLKGVFFATDMRVNGSFRKSNSFRPSKDQQRWGLDVRTRLKERFDVVTWEDYPVVNAFDSGIRGLWIRSRVLGGSTI